MGFESVAKVIHAVTKQYGASDAYFKKYNGDGGTTNGYFGSSATKEYAPAVILVGVAQEEFGQEELTPLGADAKLDIIFTVSSLEIIEKNYKVVRNNLQQKDVFIYNGVPYNIVLVRHHKLQAIELYRFYGVVKKDGLPENDPDIFLLDAGA